MFFISYLQKILFPKRCFHCSAFDSFLCNTCRTKLYTPKATPHPHPLFQALYCLYNWKDNSIERLIHALKYSGAKSIVQSLVYDVSSCIPRTFDCCIPVPLHKKRLRARGFNQSEIIAQYLSEQLNIPLYTHNIVRKRNTSSQTALNKKERLYNVAGAFSLHHPLPDAVQSILLIDDVWTTGATMGEVAALLSQQKKYTISGFVLASQK